MDFQVFHLEFWSESKSFLCLHLSFFERLRSELTSQRYDVTTSQRLWRACQYWQWYCRLDSSSLFVNPPSLVYLSLYIPPFSRHNVTTSLESMPFVLQNGFFLTIHKSTLSRLPLSLHSPLLSSSFCNPLDIVAFMISPLSVVKPLQEAFRVESRWNCFSDTPQIGHGARTCRRF